MDSAPPLRVRELKAPRRRKPRLPEPLEKRVSRPSLFVQYGLAQYRGTLQATALANAGALYAAHRNRSVPHFKVKLPSPLSKCFTLVHHTMPNGQSIIIKDTGMKHTSISRPTDHKLKAQTNGGKSTSKSAEDGSDFEASAFDRSDKKIDIIVQRILPDIPHLVSVPTNNPYGREFVHENLNTPFEDWEVKNLQHMTLISNGSRGVAWARGDWQEEYNAASPYSGFRSGTATPRSERDSNKIRTKMSLADYKAGKRPASLSQPARLGVSQAVPNGQSSASKNPESPTQQMIDQIVENSAPKLVARFVEKSHIDIVRPPQPSPPYISDAPRPAPMPKPQKQVEEGRVVWPPSNKPDWKQAQRQEEPSEQRAKPKRSDYASIASHPQHPSNQQKRQQLEQKRQKLEQKQSSEAGSVKQQPPISANGPSFKQPRAPKKIPGKSAKAGAVALSPGNSQDINEQNSATSAVVSTQSKQSDPSDSTSHTKHFDNGKYTPAEASTSDLTNTMPPLLSPLPPGLLSPDHLSLGGDTISHDSEPNQITPLSSIKSKTADARSAKQTQQNTVSPLESPLEMPPQLSPLPEWWMKKISTDTQELLRRDTEIADTMTAQNTTTNANAVPYTVGARRERSRQPDTPGVARKTTRTKQTIKTGPGKDITPDPSSSNPTKASQKINDSNRKPDSSRADRDKLVVKLRYGKRNSKAITRLLQMKARPVTEAKIQPVTTPAPSGSEARKHARVGDDSEEPSTKRNKVTTNDAPVPVPSGNYIKKDVRPDEGIEEPSTKRHKLAKNASDPSPSGSEVRKHARPAEDAEEPSTKRSKVAGEVDLQRARTPLTPSAQSPALSALSTNQKTFSTPKKGDAMKSVAMRKVDSNDGRVLTPHGGSVSTPVSVEKPRTSGGDGKFVELDALKAAHTKYTAIGTMLKRQADQILKIKEKDPGPVSDEEKRLAAVIAVESVIAYMVAFHSMDVSRQKERKVGHAEQWSQFLPFMAFATDRARGQGELYTLALLLNAVSREALERIYMERLAAEPTSTIPTYLKELATNARFRQTAWSTYREQCKVHPVDFAISVDEAKSVAVTVLADYCKKMGISWENKLKF